MKKADALKLHNEDEVIVKATGEATTVLNAYEENGEVKIETTYNGFTVFNNKQIS